nr:rhomboid family intramembrane serine protease [Bacteroidota bacterium]
MLPPVVKNLLIINGLMFLATVALQNAFGFDLADYLGLHYFAASKFSPYQFITYMFMHGGLSHVFFNMFALWMFGYVLENVWGGKRFLIYYLVTGIGAAVIHYIIFYFEFNPLVKALDGIIIDPSYGNLKALHNSLANSLSPYSGEIYLQFKEFSNNLFHLRLNPDNTAAIEAARGFVIDYKSYVLNRPNVIGASGAVFGILLAFGMLFPNTLLYIYFMFPIKAKWFVLFYGLVELYLGFTNSDSNVAHFAHLGGMIFGFFLIKYWKRKGIY